MPRQAARLALSVAVLYDMDLIPAEAGLVLAPPHRARREWT